MRLTLKSLETEMRTSFAEVNERTDRILLRLDAHIKDTDFKFREVDRRFDKVDQRFDKMDQRFDEMDKKLGRFTEDIIAGLSPYFINLENMLSNHEARITALENRH